MSNYYLVLIETSGNQNYIFSTNKLKENIGASELTYQAGTKWVLEAVAEITQNRPLAVWQNSKRLRDLLRNSNINPPIEDRETKVEILTAASGKALLLAQNENIAKQIIGYVTKKALTDAPGLDVAGVYEKIEDWNQDNSLANAIKAVHKKFEKARSRLPSPENRFLRVPIVASCGVSGLPASHFDQLTDQPISQVSKVKRDASPDAKKRLTNLDSRLLAQIDDLESIFDPEIVPWLAVVHADGNGLGQIFLNFEHYIGENQANRNYINKYREFSLALDECTEDAFLQAIKVFQEKREVLPIVPLIIGGDDLTVVCDGQYALEFTREFLQQFEAKTTEHQAVTAIAKTAFLGVDRLSACAGIAIIKRHFPFSVAYDLAESLIKSAKEVKRKVTIQDAENQTPFPCSAIDFHILYDTSGVDLSDIRNKLKPEAKTRLYNRPYIVSVAENLKTADGYDWTENHRWERLQQRITWLQEQSESSLNVTQLPPISSSQSHALRTALFLGKQEADGQYALICQRYDLKKFAESRDSLFYQDQDDIYATSFLDALDAKDFLKANDPQSTVGGNAL